jgi:hypothetical protein
MWDMLACPCPQGEEKGIINTAQVISSFIEPSIFLDSRALPLVESVATTSLGGTPYCIIYFRDYIGTPEKGKALAAQLVSAIGIR